MRDREKGTAVDYVGHFEREAAAFEAAARRAAGSRAAPAVPSCPEWVVTDLVLHLGMVHRLVARVVSERMQQPPARGDRSWRELAGEWAGWLPPGRAPRQDPVPARLLDWFGAGAAQLAERFRAAEPGERVWTWSPDHSVGFWQRMQAIEAAVHRWDAENAVGTAGPLDAAFAVDGSRPGPFGIPGLDDAFLQSQAGQVGAAAAAAAGLTYRTGSRLHHPSMISPENSLTGSSAPGWVIVPTSRARR